METTRKDNIISPTSEDTELGITIRHEGQTPSLVLGTDMNARHPA